MDNLDGWMLGTADSRQSPQAAMGSGPMVAAAWKTVPKPAGWPQAQARGQSIKSRGKA
jgi:hypothetical protein